MAQLVAKAMTNMKKANAADQASIEKLQTEYAGELKSMDVRLTKVEKGMSSFKWFGDARMRYFSNQTGFNHSSVNASITEDGTTREDKKRTETRLRLGFYGEPAENLSVVGQLKAEDTNNKDTSDGTYTDSTHNAVSINRLEFDWSAKNGVTVAGGRMWKNLGQGLIWWENPIDGFSVEKNFKKGSLMVGIGDLAPENWSTNTEYAFFANARAKISPAVELTAAYLNEHSKGTVNNSYINDWGTWKGLKKDGNYATKYDFGFLSLGVNAQLSKKWSVIAEGVHNTKTPAVATTDAEHNIDKGAHNNGFWTRLIYGKQDWSKAKTWQLYGEYFALGGNSIDSSGWGHRLNISGGNGYGGDGARGWGLGASYMLAANTNLEVTYYKLKPYDASAAGFDSYDNMGYAALSFSF